MTGGERISSNHSSEEDDRARLIYKASPRWWWWEVPLCRGQGTGSGGVQYI